MIDFDWMVALGMLRGLLAMVEAYLLTREAFSLAVFAALSNMRAHGVQINNHFVRHGLAGVGAALLALCWALGMVTP